MNTNSIGQRERIVLFRCGRYFCCPEISSCPVQSKSPKIVAPHKNRFVSWSSQHKFTELFFVLSKWERSYTDWRYVAFICTQFHFLPFFFLLFWYVCVLWLSNIVPYPSCLTIGLLGPSRRSREQLDRWLIHSLLCANWPSNVVWWLHLLTAWWN